MGQEYYRQLEQENNGKTYQCNDDVLLAFTFIIPSCAKKKESNLENKNKNLSSQACKDILFNNIKGLMHLKQLNSCDENKASLTVS